MAATFWTSGFWIIVGLFSISSGFSSWNRQIGTFRFCRARLRIETFNIFGGLFVCVVHGFSMFGFYLKAKQWRGLCMCVYVCVCVCVCTISSVCNVCVWVAHYAEECVFIIFLFIYLFIYLFIWFGCSRGIHLLEWIGNSINDANIE